MTFKVASEVEAMETLIRKALVDAEGNRTELPDAIYEIMVLLSKHYLLFYKKADSSSPIGVPFQRLCQLSVVEQVIPLYPPYRKDVSHGRNIPPSKSLSRTLSGGAGGYSPY